MLLSIKQYCILCLLFCVKCIIFLQYIYIYAKSFPTKHETFFIFDQTTYTRKLLNTEIYVLNIAANFEIVFASYLHNVSLLIGMGY